jgi:hypothetical protein
VKYNPDNDNSNNHIIHFNLSFIEEYSETILRLFDIAAEVNSMPLIEEQIIGNVMELSIDSEEDMIL